MADDSLIPWTTHTWNPWQGCTRVSPGCDNCYMHQAKKRYGQDPTKVIRSKDPTFYRPTRTKKWRPGDMVFTCSWSDFFHPDADEWRPEAWKIIRRRSDLIFQILTKRPHLIADRLPDDWGSYGWPNIWLGVTTEDQERYDERWRGYLRHIPAVVKFISIEPMLGPIEIDPDFDWVILGAETGTNKRWMNDQWERDVRYQCLEVHIPFFFKKNSLGLNTLDGLGWIMYPNEKARTRKLELED